jgi:isoleucyl-tRNA synthetase
MALTRLLVEAGRSARKASNVRIRQPLQRVLVGIPGGRELPADLVAEIADELNVREVTALSRAGEVVDITVKPNFRTLGKRFGAQTPQIAKTINLADHPELARELRETGQAKLTVSGEDITISADEVSLSEAPRSGWAVATQQDVTVALDTAITPELRRAGLAREVIRLIQNARKDADFDVTDRITLTWVAEGETADALREHQQELADAVLAVDITEHAPNNIANSTHAGEDNELGVRFWLTRVDSHDEINSP